MFKIYFKLTCKLDEWDRIIVGVTGPPSPRPGHSAMQYFERLTGVLSENDEFKLENKESESKRKRKLYYVENVYNYTNILKIIAQLENERREYDKIISMKTDIMAYDTKAYLQRVCNIGSANDTIKKK